jgi:hypothetical protein
MFGSLMKLSVLLAVLSSSRGPCCRLEVPPLACNNVLGLSNIDTVHPSDNGDSINACRSLAETCVLRAQIFGPNNLAGEV